MLALTALLCFFEIKTVKDHWEGWELCLHFSISRNLLSLVCPLLNPVFFVPFLLTSVINGTAAYLTMQVGMIGKSFAMLSWQMPSVIGAFFSTMDWKAPLLILVLIVVDGLVYFRSLRFMRRIWLSWRAGKRTFKL